MIRSTSPLDFTSAAVCEESDDASDRSAIDVDVPPPGGFFFYLVRARDACPAELGSLGSHSNGSPRTARTCP